ncbi:hypothetical protein D7Y40_22170 [Stenotrophomonas maltophilia]|nr:hypothetical protein [Stenotrophomonas maltophilia]MBA0305184.1 hypothetical protein [Stenotrophomonas maltophilia]MBA0339056.1 hypothetical protein [Stenotrophomonas maltophilia]MBA0543204.1 hypothetical protein [Stenotrophomonas maltophilia]PJL23561.1 hypothetical protein B9Y71_04045 [Stenotrophomonas maltophilia]
MGSRIVRCCRAGRPTLVGGGVCYAGLRPAPAVVPAAGRQPQKQQPKQQQKLAYWGMAGWVRLRGTP